MKIDRAHPTALSETGRLYESSARAQPARYRTALSLAGKRAGSYTGGPAKWQFRRWGRPLALTFLGHSNRACKCSLQAGLREDRRFRIDHGSVCVERAVDGPSRGRCFIL